MVKFGGHVEAIRDGDLDSSNLYLIPYNEMKTLIYTGGAGGSSHNRTTTTLHGGDNPAELNVNGAKVQPRNSNVVDENTRIEFQKAWNAALAKAEDNFREARKDLWQSIFDRLVETSDSDDDDAAFRGAHPGNAIKLFVERTSGTNGDNIEAAQELLIRMKNVYRAASTNSEGLRKIVKKFDKNKNAKLSSTLLPVLYTSSLYTGQKMIEDSCGLIRELISSATSDGNEDEDGNHGMHGGFKPLVKNNSEFRHQESVEVRMQEMEWLQRLVDSIPKDEMPHLVAHRGFHHIKDRNDKRPLENSLSAYEVAWTSGIHKCECDIALTKDEKIVLAHDENFARLSLNSNSLNSKRKVSDLTFKELISMPLLSGVRPPLLIDVLRSASAISDKAQLIIEIKPGNDAAAFALARMLIRHPDLRKSVAMIMSFDAATMHRLRAELAGAAPFPADDDVIAAADSSQSPLVHSQQHRRVTSYDHFGTMGMQSHNRLPTGSSMDLASIGLSISQTNLNDPALDAPSTGNDEVLSPSSSEVPSARSLSGLPSSMPKLMLLTVADPPNIPCELQVKYNELHRVDPWLSNAEGSLDGVYLQYEEEMMTEDGASYLRELSQRFMVGIWGYSGQDPDDYRTFEWLVRKGNCSFVNTDLPKHFKPDLLIDSKPPRP